MKQSSVQDGALGPSKVSRAAAVLVLGAVLAISQIPATAFADDSAFGTADVDGGPVAASDAGADVPAEPADGPFASSADDGQDGGDASSGGEAQDAGGAESGSPDSGAAADGASRKKKPKLSYRAALSGTGRWYKAAGGKTAGRVRGSRSLTAVKIAKAAGAGIGGGVTYSVNMRGAGWKSAKNGKRAGYRSASRPIQAIKVALSGSLKSKYRVYYRLNVNGYGWTGWAHDGQACGSTGLHRNARAFQVRLVAKGGKAPSSKAVRYASQKTKTSAFMGKVLAGKARNRASSTKWIIVVDTHANHVAVFKGKRKHWKLKKAFKCTSGAPWSPTVKGSYTVGPKGLVFGGGYSCWYYTTIYGGYMFHSVLYQPGSKTRIQDGRLGINASHGCVRLALKNARWLQRTVPHGSKIYIY